MGKPCDICAGRWGWMIEPLRAYQGRSEGECARAACGTPGAV